MIDYTRLWEIVQSNQEHIAVMNREMGIVQAHVTFISKMMWLAIGLGMSTLASTLFNLKVSHRIKNGK